MGDYNKNEYNRLYNSTKMNPYKWNISITQRAALDEYCTKNNIKLSAYLKKLVDEDMHRQGLPEIFKK